MYDLHSLAGQIQATSFYLVATTWGTRSVRECRSYDPGAEEARTQTSSIACRKQPGKQTGDVGRYPTIKHSARGVDA